MSDPLKEKILNEMVKEKKEKPLSNYQLYKAAKEILFGLTVEEGLELNEKGFVSIDPNYKGYGTPVKLVDVTDYAVTWCKYCEEDQPVQFKGHIGNRTFRSQGIFVCCDECKRILFALDHIANGEKMEGKS